METFLSTLAQITAALLALLIAALAAYFVFLRERSAQFEDKIEQNRVEISEALVRLRGEWPWPISAYVPPDFDDLYRGKANKAGAELVTDAATDLLFERGELERTFSEVRDRDSFGGPWKGRVYFWVLTQAVTVLTVGSPRPAVNPGGVFPSSPTGPGVGEWQRDFQGLKVVLMFLASLKPQMLADLQQFENQMPQQRKSTGLATRATEAVGGLFSRIELVKSKLSDIDKQVLLKRRYSFPDRVHWFSVLLLVTLAFLVGLVLPLLLLAMSRVPEGIAAVALLVSVIVFIVGASFRFARDLTSEVKPTTLEYLDARWYSPLLKVLEESRNRVQRGALVDRSLFLDAINSPDHVQFSSALAEALPEYSKATEAYNNAALWVSKEVIEVVRREMQLGPGLSAPSGSSAMVLYPPEVLDQSKLEELARRLENAQVADITVEVEMPRWSRTELRIPKGTFGSAGRLRAVLETARESVIRSGNEHAFRIARENLNAPSSRLQQALRSGP